MTAPARLFCLCARARLEDVRNIRRTCRAGVFAVALMPVSDALAAVLAGAEPLPEEMISLDQAYHRVLARDVAARRTQPPQAMSAMDGYAVRAADAATIDSELTVIGEVAAGRPFAGTLGAGDAVRIFTGG